MIRTAAWVAFVSIGLAQQPSVQPSRATAQVEATLAQLTRYDYGQSPEPLYQLTIMVRDAIGSVEQTRTIERRLDQFLASGATLPAKQAASQQLSMIATETSLPVLSAMLMHTETSEMG